MSEPSWLVTLKSWVDSLIEQTGLPRDVVLFALILGAGFALAVLLRSVARRLALRGAMLVSRIGRTSLPPDMNRPAKAVGSAVFWLVLLVTVMVATEALGLPVVTVWLSQIANYVPRIIAAIFIAALGAVVAKVARKVTEGAARSASVPAHDRIGRLTEVAVLIAVGLVAVEQLGIEISLLTTVLLIVIAALFGGGALAFGLGGRDWIANVLSAHYVERLYQIGQTIRVREFEGKILRITETAVVLESAEGEVAVPAREFASTPSTLLLRKNIAPGAHS
jgi:hypothetical protein